MAKRAKTTAGKGINEIWKREVGEVPPRTFAHRLGASQDLVLRLGIYKNLERHRGCVNTVSFNADGDILVSGSDDRFVMLWDWESARVKLSFHSGHTNNVFQAKFMPYTNDRSIVTCAADGQVRHAQIQEDSQVNTRLLGKHQGRAHKLAIEPGSPHIVYTCGEDGSVRHFDLRSSSATKLFTCKAFSPDRSAYMPTVHLNTIAIDPRNPNLFAVGGTDEFAHLYDIRKYNWDGSNDFGQPTDCFSPQHLIGDEQVITGLAFSNQSELLVSYSDEHIYLFTRDMGIVSNPVPASPSSEASNASGESNPITKASPSANDVGADTAEPVVYKGHRNCDTVKGVSFFGPRDEYVVSGSDCGRIFIWRKKDGEILRAMEADKDIVNCIESHPHVTMLASSGIEHDIKIWTPTAVDRAPLPVKVEQLRPRRSIGHYRLFTPEDLLQMLPQQRQRTTSSNNVDDTAAGVNLLELFSALNRDVDGDHDSHDGDGNDSDGDVADTCRVN
ncbi:hypothetical protein MKW94_004819 [Papaver nudicaule]|uniref:Uncharacterized protein n=1 Tax=Papaver nudicaule TaxID=74823 RepID=A0AA42B0M0_PAPNU|nr:hypothetical protein [Papaver nudicaule]